MKPKIDYTLCLCTDRDLMRAPSLEKAVELAVQGGCTLIQLREKKGSSLEFYTIAKSIRKLTRALGVPFIVNDRVDIALAVDADGVHLGQKDLPAEVARRLMGADKILGVSAANLKEALEAQECGADYLGVGALFPTETKPDAEKTPLSELKDIRRHITLPVVGIGGIGPETVPRLKGTGVDGIAVISAILAQRDIAGAARELKQLFCRMQEEGNEEHHGGDF